jgi:D-3-phosphoglycerate dehydrogenase
MKELPVRLPDADGVIAGLEPWTADMLENAPKLRIISRYGVGYDAVDLDAAKKAGVKVAVTPGANADSVADLAVTLMLAAARHVPYMDASIKAGGQKRPAGVELWRKTLGVVGTGRIGKGVIKRLSGFEMRFLCYDTYKDDAFLSAYGGRYVDLYTLLREADFITLHSPLTDETRNMIGGPQFSIMKKNAVLVNTARGGIIDEAALYQALKDGEIGAAALDATVEEPPYNSPLCCLPNCILTPHAGAATVEAAYNMGMMAAKNLLDVLNSGTCPNLV